MKEVQVKVPGHSYTIKLGSGVIKELPAELKRLNPSSCLIATNITVGSLYLKRLPIFAMGCAARNRSSCLTARLIKTGAVSRQFLKTCLDGGRSQVSGNCTRRRRGRRPRRLCGRNLYARYPLYSGSDNTTGDGGLFRRWKNRYEYDGRKKLSRHFSPARSRDCRL